MEGILVEAKEMIPLEKYYEDEEEVHTDETLFFPAQEVYFQGDWQEVMHKRWERVPAGYEREKRRIIIAKHVNGKLYLIIQRNYRYELDNGLKYERSSTFSIHEIPEVKESKIEEILASTND